DARRADPPRRFRGGGQPAARRPGDAAGRHAPLEAQPGRAGHGAGADAAQPEGRVGRLARRPGRPGGPVRGGRAPAAPRRAVGPGGRGLLRGLLQRHALAALPRRRGPAGVPPALVAGLRAGQRALRRGHRRRGRARRHGLGAGLPAPAAADRAPRAAARPEDRLLPAHPLPAHRAVPAAALAHPHRRGTARRRPRRLPHPRRRAQLPLARLALHRGDPGPRSQRADLPRPLGEARRVPDLHRLRAPRRDLAQRRRPAAGEEHPGGPREPRADHPRRRPARLHQGHRRAAPRVRGAARRGPGRRHRHDPARHAQPRARGALPADARRHRAVRRPHQRRVRPGRPTGAALPAPVAAARRAGRLLRRRRRHARHAAARRHEPRGQGVRRLPRRPRRRARALGVRRGRDRAQGLRPGQPARHRRRQGRAAPRADDGARREPAEDEGAAPPGAHPRRRPLGALLPRRARPAGPGGVVV
ncbi:MAG: Trehalose-6-phosphate synthase, partial [uncultured Pseudonocardia sp.]